MARSWDARRGSFTLAVAALGTAVVLAALGILSNLLSGVALDAAFLIAFVFWLGSAVLALPVLIAAVLGIVFGVRSGNRVAVVLGGLAIVLVIVGVVWFLSV